MSRVCGLMLNPPPFPQFAELLRSSVKRNQQSSFLKFILQAQFEEKAQGPAGLSEGCWMERMVGGGLCQGYLSLRRTSSPVQAHIP